MNVDQKELVNIISNDDIEQFKNIQASKYLVNIQLLPFERLKIPNDPKLYCPKGATALIYCVLCQSTKILEYIIKFENLYSPDYFKEVEGFFPLLCSILTKDIHCFYLLADRIFGGSDTENSKKSEVLEKLIRSSCVNGNYEALIQLLTNYVDNLKDNDLLKLSYTKLDPILATICFKFSTYDSETLEAIEQQSEKDQNSHIQKRLSDYYEIISLDDDEINLRYNSIINNFTDFSPRKWPEIQI